MSNESKRNDSIQGEIVHEYDGIEEADNQLPTWWVACFLGSIAFAFAYWIGFQLFNGGPTPYQEYVRQRATIEQARVAELAASPLVSAELLEELAAQPAMVLEGRAVFAQQCVPCHGDKAQGKIGPNLTDHDWLHGGDPMAIHATITNGVLAKGMPAWGAVLGPTATRSVAAYVLSLRNTDVPGKAAEGTPESPKQSAL